MVQEVLEIRWGIRFPKPHTYSHTYPTTNLHHTYPIPTHTYPKQSLPNLYLTYSKVRICQGALVSVIPPELKNKHRERSFFLAKECKSRVKFISVVDEKCAGK